MQETMLPARSITTAGLMVALGVLPAIPAGPVAAQVVTIQSDPMEVTTDTAEYCVHLLDRISELARLSGMPVPREVTDLTTEGQRMCEHGQTRGGIVRLRSALMIVEKSDSTTNR
jgi:hypothetical protein